MGNISKQEIKRIRLYLDESGDHSYNLLEEIGHRYLAVLGVWFEREDTYILFSEKLQQLKDTIFGERSPDNPVILHRTEIINRKGPFGCLREGYIRNQFNNQLLDLITNTDFKMICVIIDKKNHLHEYHSPMHPYHYCLVAILQRYAEWLNHKNYVGDVMAESRGRNENNQLKQAYLRLYESGT